MFDIQNYTYGQSVNVSCELVRNSTAFAVKWRRTEEAGTEFEVLYSTFAKRPKTVLTKQLNMTIEDVSPGEVYHLQVRTVNRRRPGFYTYGLNKMFPYSKLCIVPEKGESLVPVGPSLIMMMY